jgi:CRP-like cAMP-binding protein
MSNNLLLLNSKEVIFREGENASALYLIKSGEVLCLKSSKERLIPVFKAKTQDIIGESAMLSDAPCTYSAITLTPVELIRIDNADLIKVLESAPEWLMDLTTTMISRFQSTSNLVAENRILNEAILSEEDFPSSLEIEYKKLLSNQ